MPGPLKNARHERFAQEVAKGASADAAYAAAGFKSHRQNASRLMTKDDVRNRLLELKTEAARETVITVADITQRLLKIAEKGEDSKEAPLLSVARASLMDVAKLNGMIVEKTQRELSQDQMNALMEVIRANPGMAAQMLAQMGIA